MYGFRIKEMYRHENGFCVAVILSHYDQNEYTLHNRFGAWHIGDPNLSVGPMREAAVIDPDLAGTLQQRYKQIGDDLPTKVKKPNIFTAKKAKPKENIFKAKKEKGNIFKAKADRIPSRTLKIKGKTA